MLYEQITKESIEALKAHDELRLSVLRGMRAAFTNELVAQKRKPTEILNDEEIIAVIRRLAKQRKESIEQFQKGGREDLAEKEEKELDIIETYLPQMMNKEDIHTVVLAKQKELGIEDKSKMGILIGAVMKDLKGKAEGNDVKEIVESLF